MLTAEVVQQVLFRFNENTPRIKNCLDRLNEEQIWQRPSPAHNSIGNILLHLCGNITQYVISTLGNRADERNRDLEFSTRGGLNKEMLFQKLSDAVASASTIIAVMDEEALLKKSKVQVYELSGFGIILHVTEHYAYHTGQIAFYTKLLTGQDLGFYANINLNKKPAL
jgi:uncharacterized damage-inducible protein DinB